MVIIEKKQIDQIPLLHVVDEKQKNEQLPFVIFLHGFTSTKENNLHYSYLLAEKGFRVVLPEAPHHGERDLGISEDKLTNQFWEIVIQTIHELSKIKQYYEAEAQIDHERIGLVGTSMGGIATLGALTQYDWIKVSVSLMGVPTYQKLANWQIAQLKKQNKTIEMPEDKVKDILEQLEEYDLSLHPEKLKDRPLLFWHGKKDPVVPYEYAHQFYQDIIRKKSDAEHIQFILEEEAEHKVSQSGIKNTVKWFEKYLGRQ